MRLTRLCGTIGGLAAAVFLAAGCAELVYPESRAPADPLFPDTSSLMYPNPPEPELSSSRRITEQDCSKPVDSTSGNLRCK
jgi:hypothetical protein